MSVVDKDADVGGYNSCHSSDGIKCGADGCGYFVWPKVEPAIYGKAILEDDEGGGFVG